eukprot:6261385-Pyramimonas_sp.AAC.1
MLNAKCVERKKHIMLGAPIDREAKRRARKAPCAQQRERAQRPAPFRPEEPDAQQGQSQTDLGHGRQ